MIYENEANPPQARRYNHVTPDGANIAIGKASFPKPSISACSTLRRLAVIGRLLIRRCSFPAAMKSTSAAPAASTASSCRPMKCLKGPAASPWLP
mgnify:CR=1 FL=1